MKEAKEKACSADGCDGTFTPCRYNGHKQDRCEACVKERRRMQQRGFAKKKYRKDAAYRQRERERKRESRRATKAKQLAAEGAVAAEASLQAVADLLTGLLAQFADTDDAEAVADHATTLARRGQRLAAGRHLWMPGYPKADVEEIFNPGFEAGRARPRRSL